MRFVTQINQYLSLKDEYGKVDNQQIGIYAKSGFGKGLASEGIMEEYHKQGYTILCIADPKGVWESAFQMFKPNERYHLEHLSKIGKIPQEKKVKLYHPFSFALPSNEYLPEINFYTFSLKQLGRPEWSLINETESDTDTIKIILQASQELTKEDGIYNLMQNVQNMIKGKSEGRKKKADPKNFYLETGVGTTKSLAEISNQVKPFRREYLLAKDSSPYNINWEKILLDKENYHVFSTHWIKDEKIQDFVVLSLFNGVVETLRHLRKSCKVLVVLPEINKLCGYRPEGHKRILSKYIKEFLGIIRNMGSSSLSDSQVWLDVDEEVRNKNTESFIGELKGGVDIDRITKAYGYKREIKEQLRKMEYKNSYFRVGYEDDPVILWFSSAGHKEENDNFFDRYRKEKKLLKKYSEQINKMREMYDEEENKVKERIKKQERFERERREKERREKEEKKIESQKTEQKIEKLKGKVDENIEEKMKRCYEMSVDSNLDKRERSWRKIAQKVGLKSHLTAKKYAEIYEQKIKGNTQLNQLEEKMQEQEFADEEDELEKSDEESDEEEFDTEDED